MECILLIVKIWLVQTKMTFSLLTYSTRMERKNCPKKIA